MHASTLVVCASQQMLDEFRSSGAILAGQPCTHAGKQCCSPSKWCANSKVHCSAHSTMHVSTWQVKSVVLMQHLCARFGAGCWEGWSEVRGHDDLGLGNLHVAHYVGLTTWCHLGHMFVKFVAPMDVCNGHLIKCDGHACWILPLASMRKCRECWIEMLPIVWALLD